MSSISSASTFDSTSSLLGMDLKVNDDGSLSFWVKSPKIASKQGDTVELMKLDNKYCPVSAMQSYLAKRETVTSRLDLPLFIRASGVNLTKSAFSDLWKRALTAAGAADYVVNNLRNHSFRSGLVSMLQEKGLSESQMKSLGRWRSDAYLVYLRDVDARREAKKQALTLCDALISR